MAKKRTGVMGAMSNLIRWTIWGLAAILAVAIYLNWTKSPQRPAADDIAVLPPADIAVSGAQVETAEDAAQDAEATTEVAEEVAESARAETGEGETPSAGVDQVATSADEIRIPGDDAIYTLLNAFRRDDGAIEITTLRVLDDAQTTAIRLIRCAPLEAGLIAEGDGPRNDAPEMVRIPLGDATAMLAATACGAMK